MTDDPSDSQTPNDTDASTDTDTDTDTDHSRDPLELTNLPDEYQPYLVELDPAELRELAEYALILADKRTRSATSIEIEDPTNPKKSQVEAYLIQEYGKVESGAPPKAVATVKNINGYHYFYWQWHDNNDGDYRTKSKYICPVQETPFHADALKDGLDSATDAAPAETDANEDDDVDDNDPDDGGDTPTSTDGGSPTQGTTDASSCR